MRKLRSYKLDERTIEILAKASKKKGVSKTTIVERGVLMFVESEKFNNLSERASSLDIILEEIGNQTERGHYAGSFQSLDNVLASYAGLLDKGHLTPEKHATLVKLTTEGYGRSIAEQEKSIFEPEEKKKRKKRKLVRKYEPMSEEMRDSILRR